MAILDFFSTTAGRLTRGMVGTALIVIGLLVGGWGWLLIAVGAVFVLVGVFDVCLLAPLFGKPFGGKAFRAAKSR